VFLCVRGGVTDSRDGFGQPALGVIVHNSKGHDMLRCCFDCDYFQIDGKEFSEIAEGDWDGGRAEGECRFGPPVIGPEIERHGESIRLLGEFPRVLVTDWCGQFRPRSA
jgi:hypothetical protein